MTLHGTNLPESIYLFLQPFENFLNQQQKAIMKEAQDSITLAQKTQTSTDDHH